jgi:uracil-DNA glycosylase family 4
MPGEVPPSSAAAQQGSSRQQPLREWLDYFHDLGIHDFYRQGDFAAASLAEASQAAAPAGSESPHSPRPELSPGLPIAPPRLEPAPRAAPIAVFDFAAADHPAVPSAQGTASDPAPAYPSPEMPVPQLLSFDQLAPRPESPLPPADRAAALQAIQDYIGDCTRCPLAYAGRRKIVFGDGSPNARLMFIGEGPGADEDAQGIPFVGKAGQLLNNMIAAMGIQRAEVHIANIVKCRPPNNRVPEPVEAGTCSQFLLRQIDVVQPQVIVALGSTAATYLLGIRRSLSALRGAWHTCRGAKLAVTYHPAFLLRDPRMKAEAWKDLQMVMAELNLTPPTRKKEN